MCLHSFLCCIEAGIDDDYFFENELEEEDINKFFSEKEFIFKKRFTQKYETYKANKENTAESSVIVPRENSLTNLLGMSNGNFIVL